MKEFGTIFVIWHNARFSELAKAARGLHMIYGFPLVRAVLRSVQIGIPPVKSFMERLFVWFKASFYWRRHILGKRCNQCTYNLRISAS